MIVFEIYFYFNYVVNIERKEFLDKINSYIGMLNKYKSNVAISLYITTQEIDNIKQQLYQNYLNAINHQERMAYRLLFLSCEIAGAVGTIVLLLILYAKYKRMPIKWKSIIYENISMFALLGLFEYIFFTHVILQYNPLTDQELEYYIFNDFLQYYQPQNISNIPIIPNNPIILNNIFAETT